ncbi:hypothetical protein [Klebsiella sp. BIGb0407]|uniref:hypothetical protein n=1 Tax=Klebsiella sp. BIGb0407 TaxID=2940603 RepID=UPI00216A184C|nr:hypothetical protein [Klebsiella sp. BIGb0407]MCS3432871.1 hypothetical protein [Klebsiella sp. BIGb0407]
MFIMSGVSHYLISSLSDTYSTNVSFPIGSISNTSYESLRQEIVAPNTERTSANADEAHDMAYSAYAHRKKRAAGASRYSENDCQNASLELTSLVSVAVAYPSTWYRYKSRIQELQGITKSADCKAGRG